MRSAGKSDVGLVRKINEDSFACINLSQKLGLTEEDVQLFIVADGMGGHNAGEVASSMAIDEIAGYIIDRYAKLDKNEDFEIGINTLIKEAISHANDKIYKKSLLESSCFGMGTTLSLVFIINYAVYIGHIGDSRIYLIRNNTITRLTDDHSLVAELVKNGTIKPEEAHNHPQKNIITRSLGTEYSIQSDAKQLIANEGDLLLICSDGLTNMLEDEEILNIVNNIGNIDRSCIELINEAKNRGGNDNITAIVIQIGKGGEADDR